MNKHTENYILKRGTSMKKRSVFIGLGLLSIFFVVGFITISLFSPIKSTIIISGSMEPVLKTNSMVFTDYSIPFEDIEKGDIIRYDNGEIDRNVVHRVFQVNYIDGKKTILTKGDNNEFMDSWVVTEENYKAKVVGNTTILKPVVDLFYGDITKLGSSDLALRSMILCMFLIVLVISVVFVIYKLSKKRFKEVNSMYNNNNEICVEFTHGRKNKCKTNFKGSINKILVSGLVLTTLLGTTTPAFAAELPNKFTDNNISIAQEYGVSVEDSISNIRNTIKAIEDMKANGSISTEQIETLAKQIYVLEMAVKSSNTDVSKEVISVLDSAEIAIKGLSGVKDVEIAIISTRASLGIDTATVQNKSQGKYPTTSFDDLNQAKWASEYIMLCLQHGAIAGTRVADENGVSSFKPNDNVTLGQFLAVITRLISPDKIQGDAGVHWATPNYNAAVQSNIIRGSDFESSPASLNSNLSRQDMAYILVNAAKANGETLESIPDVNLLMSDYNSINPSRQDAVKRAYSNGLLMGDTQGKFNPHNTMTRAQMATVVCRLMEYAPRDTAPTPTPQIESKYVVSAAGETQGMLRSEYSRQYEVQALQSVRTGEDNKGVYVTFTAPTLPSEIQNDFTFNFNAAVTKPDGDYFADRIRVNLKSGESRTVYFVSYQDTGVKSSQIGIMHIGIAIENSEGKSMFTRSIENNDKSNAYGVWYDGSTETTSLDSSAVWQSIGK